MFFCEMSDFSFEYQPDSPDSKSYCDDEMIQKDLFKYYDVENTSSNSYYNSEIDKCCTPHYMSDDSRCENYNVNDYCEGGGGDKSLKHSSSMYSFKSEEDEDKASYSGSKFDELDCCCIAERVKILYDDNNIEIDENSSDKVICHFCKLKIEKSECFINKDNQYFICIKCAVKEQISKKLLKDWEEFHSKHDYPRLKRCIRCGKFKNKQRFKTGRKYCSYCSLKKRLAYACKVNCA